MVGSMEHIYEEIPEKKPEARSESGSGSVNITRPLPPLPKNNTASNKTSIVICNGGDGDSSQGECCQMAKFDPFLSLDCAGFGGGGRNQRKGRDHILQRSVAEPHTI